MSIRLRQFGSTWKPYQSTLAHQQYIRKTQICIYVVVSKIVTPRVKHIEITVYLIQEQFDNGIFVPKYEKSSVIPEDMCTKSYSGTTISWITKWMTGFRLYPTIDT